MNRFVVCRTTLVPNTFPFLDAAKEEDEDASPPAVCDWIGRRAAAEWEIEAEATEADGFRRELVLGLANFPSDLELAVFTGLTVLTTLGFTMASPCCRTGRLKFKALLSFSELETGKDIALVEALTKLILPLIFVGWRAVGLLDSLLAVLCRIEILKYSELVSMGGAGAIVLGEAL